MDTKMIIEIVGYIGSLLVLVSFLMTSVFKLRVVNTIGSFIFMVYALIIKSYPTAIMNFCLVLINVRFLWKMSHSSNEYELVEVDSNDKYLDYLLNYYKKDIMSVFPNTDFDFKNKNVNYVITSSGKPVGITMGHEENNVIEFLFDYTIPEFRDLSIGKFLLEKLKERGIKKVISKAPTESHAKYLESNGFVKDGDYYTRDL